MPLIFEETDLVDQLVNSGAEFQLKFTKEGQDATATSADYQNLGTLLEHLQNSLVPSQDPNLISHENDKGIDLTSPNMDSMGDFVAWLVSNGTKVGGKNVVYSGNQERPSEDYDFYKVEPGTGELKVPLTRPDRTMVGYWIDPQLLKQFLVSLQSNPKLKTNVIFQVQLLKLIQDANRQLDVGVSEKYTEPEKTYPDTTAADSLPPVLDPKNYGASGDKRLTFGDLKDLGTFNSWLSKNGIGLITASNTINNNPDFDKCVVMNILAQRAAAMSRNYKSKDEQALAAAYLRRLQSLASESSCQLTGVSTTGQKPATDQTAAINRALQSLPLSLNDIDFGRINSFFGNVRQLMSNNATVMGYISNTEQLMQQASNMTPNKDTVFQLGIPPAEFSHYIAGPNPGQRYFPLLQTLDQIVDNARAVVSYLYSQYGDRISDDQRAFLFGQIGKRPDDSSIYKRNVDSLRQLARVQMSSKPVA